MWLTELAVGMYVPQLNTWATPRSFGILNRPLSVLRSGRRNLKTCMHASRTASLDPRSANERIATSASC
jgi:hypothetical protein